jgi:hypothetical protein
MMSVYAEDPIFVIEVAKEGLITPKNPLISKSLGLELEEHNDTLSRYGKQQQYLLGLEMRERYDKSIFEGKCNPLHIYAYSVNKQSTMMSGQIQLFGICPLGLNEDIAPEMVKKASPPFDFPEKDKIAAELGLKATPHNFMPLPLHSTYDDGVFGNENTRPKSDLVDEPNEEFINAIFKDSFYSYLKKLTGKHFKKASQALDTANEIIWLSKTKNIEEITEDKVKLAEEFIFQYYNHYWDYNSKLLYASKFLRKLLCKLQDAVTIELNKHKERKIVLTESEDVITDYDLNLIKYYLFEVTDLQMYTYTIILDIDFYDYIPPSSILIFELYRKYPLDKRMKVADAMQCFILDIKFNDHHVDSPFCRSPCKLNKFYDKLYQFLQ